MIPSIKKVADDIPVRVIDLYDALNHQPELFPDKIHPNAAGARLIAETVATALVGKERSRPH